LAYCKGFGTLVDEQTQASHLDEQFLEQQATTAENDDFLDFIRALGTTYLK
jgi:hypothetical protein